MNPLSRRSILGGIAAAPLGVPAAAQMAQARMSQMAEVAGSFSPNMGNAVLGSQARSLSPEMRAARRALRKLEGVPIQARIAWVDGMKSWTPATRARAIIEAHEKIESDKSRTSEFSAIS